MPLDAGSDLCHSFGAHFPGGHLFRLHRLLWLALLIFVAAPASAQFTRDNAANKKIEEAINTHYVATDFDKAEGVLLGTINACGDKCSPQTIAKAWMYVGIVRGSGKNDQAGAREAFRSALTADPQVKLDAVLATPETQATFAAAGGSQETAPPPAVPTPAPTPEPGPATAAVGGLTCTPDVRSVQTRRPIPVQCQGSEDVMSMELRYKVFGSESWQTLPMQKHGDSFRAQLPCSADENSGTLRVYVRAKDALGDEVDTWGNKQAPIEFAIAESVAEPPPSFDDGEPPPRCPAKEECPPDFPGCGDSSEGPKRGNRDWGEACDNSLQCKSGLLCTDGTCQAAPSCDTDADCSTGKCTNGKCDIPAGAGEGPTSPYKKNWLGLHVAQDVAFVGGNNICDPALGSVNYACFYEGTSDEPFFHTPYPLRDGINNGAVLATTRVLLSFDRALSARFTVGARAGFAFGGGPPAGMEKKTKNPKPHDKGTAGTAFLPVHLEVRGAFWFLPLTSKFLRAYVLAGGGMAQVDAKVKINEYDCEDADEPPFPTADGDISAFEQCRSGKKTYYDIRQHKAVPVDAWSKMGQGFVEGGAGAMLAFSPNVGATVEFKALYLFPASGLVLEPSLGVELGF